MPFNLAAILSVVTGVFLAAVTFATVRVSRRFFQRLIEQHPELANSFPRQMIGTRYGPILPSKMDYLKEKRFKDLSDPSLRTLGQLSLTLLTVHAVAFTTFLICTLWWSATRYKA
jgi:ABC-type multidrug transport system fused ATPase/permease subunit